MDYVQECIQSLRGVSVDESIVEGAAAYLVNDVLFAVYYQNKKPKQLSLRGDKQLMAELRARYESVVPPPNLDRTTWNTYLLTDQFSEDFITSLIIHSYIASGGDYIGNQ